MKTTNQQPATVRTSLKMEAATDIDRLRTFRIVTDVCQHQIFRPGGGIWFREDLPVYHFCYSVRRKHFSEFHCHIRWSILHWMRYRRLSVFGWSGKVYLIYGTDDRTELFSGRSDPGNADYIWSASGVCIWRILNGTAISIALFGKASVRWNGFYCGLSFLQIA